MFLVHGIARCIGEVGSGPLQIGSMHPIQALKVLKEARGTQGHSYA